MGVPKFIQLQKLPYKNNRPTAKPDTTMDRITGKVCFYYLRHKNLHILYFVPGTCLKTLLTVVLLFHCTQCRLTCCRPFPLQKNDEQHVVIRFHYKNNYEQYVVLPFHYKKCCATCFRYFQFR